MTLFAYKAFTKQGKKTQGTVEAVNEQDAKDKVRELNLILAELTLQKKAKSSQKLTKDSLVVFTTQIAQLLTAKIPLYESLMALEEQSREEAFHPVILGLSERIKTGSSLSQAMYDFSESFSPLYRSLVSAGEAVGSLDLTFSRLASFLTARRRIARQLASSLTYPIILACLMVVAITVLVGFVIPSIEVLFEGKQVPKFTQIVLSVSHFLQSYGLVVISLAAIFLVFFFIRIRNPAYKAKVQRFIIRVPIIKKYIILSSLASFARTLSTLLEGGLPLAQALSFAQEALQNARLEEIVKRTKERMIEGMTFSQEMSRYKEIPPLFSRMIKIGEESGKLAPMLSQIAAIYEEQTERQLEKIVTLSQPILLLVMGSIIGTVLLAILLPLSDFGSSIQM